jgi:NCS1 family nucleobase:cation symporter-1
VIGWIYLLPGFAHAVTPRVKVPQACTHLYYLAYPLGFTVSFLVFFAFNKISPPPGQGLTDEFDVYGTFTEDEAARLNFHQPEVVKRQSEEEVDEPARARYTSANKSA